MRLPPKLVGQGRTRPVMRIAAGPLRPPVDVEEGDGVVVITLPRPPTPPLSMNQAIGMHWARYAEHMDPWRDEFAWTAKAHRPAVRALALPVTVELTLRFAAARRRDNANAAPCMKSAVDGCTIAGLWDDDSPAYVRTLEPVLLVDRDSQAVTLTIRGAVA